MASIGTLALACATPALAQTEGRIGVGASVTVNNTTDGDVANVYNVGPLVRVNPRRGWRYAAALNWYRADLSNPDGTDAPFARLQVRPLMAGIGYTVGPPRTLVNFSIVAGPSFNKARFKDEFREQTAGSPLIEAKTSVALRPGISITQSVAPRVGVVGFAGYMINRPEVIYRSTTGQQVEDRWRGDSVVLSVGVVYSIF
jgi:hypothetical protein